MPGERGTQLGAELFELYRAGRQSLPAVAMEFTLAATQIGVAGEAAEAAFVRPAMFGGTLGPAYGEWLSLMRTVRQLVWDTGEALDDTATALVLAADAYAETDQAASRELERLKREDRTGW